MTERPDASNGQWLNPYASPGVNAEPPHTSAGPPLASSPSPAGLPYPVVSDLSESPEPALFTYRRLVAGVEVVPPWPGAPLPAIDAVIAGRSLRRPGWGIPDSIVSIVLTVVLTNLFVLVAFAVLPDQPIYNDSVLLAGLLVQWLVMAGWPVIVSYWRGNGPRLDFGLGLAPRDLGPGLVGALAIFAAALVSALLTTLVFGNFTSNAGKAISDLHGYPALQTTFVFLGVFGAPVVEELAFRGLLWSALAKRGLNPWWCTGISAAVFAASHLEWVRFFVLFSAGLVLGALRQRTGRLGPSILAHVSLNALAFVGGGVWLVHF